MKCTRQWQNLIDTFSYYGNRHLTVVDVNGRRLFDGTTHAFCKMSTPIKACPVQTFTIGRGGNSLDPVTVTVW